MKAFRMAMSFALLFLATAAVAESNALQSLAQLKSMAGDWQGKTAEGSAVRVSYKLTANGSTLMSEILAEKHHGDLMVSMFHLDGDRLMMTHYCSAGNQPRMVATISPDGKTFTFDFVDGTNLVSATPGHMQRAVFTLLDSGHHTEDWIFLQNDGKQHSEHFDLQRMQ
jgi:hypothetical protein